MAWSHTLQVIVERSFQGLETSAALMFNNNVAE